MNYAYDILLNFQNKYFEFYEWNKKDIITHIKKIPILKITTKDLNIIKTNKIKLDKEFLKKIENKAETFKKEKINAILLTDGEDTVALKINKPIQKSSIQIDEEEIIINKVKNKEIKSINYQIVKKEKQIIKTRKEIENEKYLKTELKKLYINKEYQKLDYLFLECFNKKEKSKEKEYQILKKEIQLSAKNSQIILNFFNLTKQLF